MSCSMGPARLPDRRRVRCATGAPKTSALSCEATMRRLRLGRTRLDCWFRLRRLRALLRSTVAPSSSSAVGATPATGTQLRWSPFGRLHRRRATLLCMNVGQHSLECCACRIIDSNVAIATGVASNFDFRPQTSDIDVHAASPGRSRISGRGCFGSPTTSWLAHRMPGPVGIRCEQATART